MWLMLYDEHAQGRGAKWCGTVSDKVEGSSSRSSFEEETSDVTGDLCAFHLKRGELWI